MKRLFVLLVCISMILLTGCMKTYPLSEKQTDIVAEYMAGLLLKNDKSYSPSLLSFFEVNESKNHELEEEKELVSTKDQGDSIDEGSIDESQIDDDSNTQSSSIDYTLSDIIEDSDFDIQYIGYRLADTYPEDETNHVFSVDPKEGHRLLVVNFTVENISDNDKIMDLSKEQIQYKLDINETSTYRPQLVLLENNLQYINMNIKAGEKIPAVLIFEVAVDLDMTNMKLTLSKDTRNVIIEIK